MTRWVIFVLLILCFAEPSHALAEWGYTSFRFVQPIANDKLPAVIRAGSSQLNALMPTGSGTHPLWGVEQVYVDTTYAKKIIVKRGVQLTQAWPVGGWSKVGSGFVLHIKRPEGITAFYAAGFTNLERLEIERQIRGSFKTAGLIDLVLPRASASETVSSSRGAKVPGQPSEKTVEISGNGDSLPMCIAKMTGEALKKKAEDAWKTTKETASSLYNDPLGAAKAGASYISSGASKVYDAGKSAVSYAGSAFADPKKVYDDVSSAIDKSREMGEQLYNQAKTQISDFASWPQPIKNAVMCQIAGQLAAEGLLTVAGMATGAGAGAAAAKALLLTKSIYEKLKLASTTIKAVIGAKDLSMSAKIGMVKDLVSGKRSREAIELALKEDGKATAAATAAKVADAAPAAATGANAAATGEASTAAAASKEAVASNVKNLSPEALEKVQAANRALSKTDREAAIEKQLGMKPGSLTSEQKALIDKVHNTDCATRKCSAEEIKSLKDLKAVKAAFPDATPQQIKDLYRANLLGREVDEKAFADLMKQSFKKNEPLESAEAVTAARATAQREALRSASEEVAALEAKPNGSAIALAEARHREGLLRRQVDSIAEPLSNDDKKAFSDLMKQSFRPSGTSAATSEMSAAAREESGRAMAASLLRKAESPTARPQAPKPAPLTDAQRNEFSAYLKTQKFNPGSQGSTLERAASQVRSASSSNPVPARYVSSVTGQEIKGEIIGAAKEGELGADAKVLLRSRGADGRITTREVALRDVAVGEKGSLVRESAGAAKTAEQRVDEIAREATSNTERIRKLDAEAEQAMRPGGGGLEKFGKIDAERSALVKADAPLDLHEVRAIEAVSQAYSREGLAQRLPLRLTPTGNIEIRSGGGLQSIGLAAQEKADLAQVQKIVEARRSAPRAIEDKPYFERVQSLNEASLVRGRIREQQQQISQQIRSFTGSNSMELPRVSTFYKYEPAALAKSYGADGQSSSVKNALKTVHEIVSNRDTSLSSSDVRRLQDSLGTLRSERYRSVVENNPELRKFLDYSAARAGHSRLTELNGLVGH